MFVLQTMRATLSVSVARPSFARPIFIKISLFLGGFGPAVPEIRIPQVPKPNNREFGGCASHLRPYLSRKCAFAVPNKFFIILFFLFAVVAEFPYFSCGFLGMLYCLCKNPRSVSSFLVKLLCIY